MVDLTLFLHLGHEYNIIEDIALKIATKTLIFFLLFLSALSSLFTYQRDKDVVKINSSYIALDELSYKFLVNRKEREKKKESVLLISNQINIAASC